MKARFLTLGISYLLLATFPGTTEANKIDLSDTGTAFFQLATASNSRILRNGKNLALVLGESDNTLKWLLVLYGIEEAGEFIDLIDPAKSPDEGLPGEGYGQDAPPDRATRLSYFADLLYGDRLLPQASATTARSSAAGGDESPVQSTGSILPTEKDPGRRYETIPLTFLNPPTRVYLGEQAPAKQKEPNLPAGKDPGTRYEIPPLTFLNPPTRVHPGEQTPAKGREPNPGKAPVVTPASPPDFAGPPTSPQHSGYQPPVPAAGRAEFPADNRATATAPVPEPATILLLATGIAGLAFSGRRRTSAAGEQRQGAQMSGGKG